MKLVYTNQVPSDHCCLFLENYHTAMLDVNILANHKNKLNKMASGLARAVPQHENHLSSFIQSTNKQMDNLMSGITENNLAIKFIQNELHTTIKNIKQSFDYMIGLLSNQVNTSTQLNHALDQSKDGIVSLVKRHYCRANPGSEFVVANTLAKW